jgi:hypothetical protein
MIFFYQKFKLLLNILLPFLLVLTSIILLQPPAQTANSHNPITIENQKPGTPDWQLTNPATGGEIEGYASLTSVNRGEEIKLFVNTKEPSYTIDIFRMGWYGGAGGRRMVAPINLAGVRQPPAIVDQATGLIECNWQDPYILKIQSNSKDPAQWTSGFYLAKLTASKSGRQSYIIFVVRDDNRPTDILFQSSVTTYQAYNNWGGMSLYRWNSRGKQAFKVSFNRPYAASPNRAAAYGMGAGEFLTNFQPKRRTSSGAWEYNMVRWLEREGYDVAYSTDIDTHNNTIVGNGKPMLEMHKAFLTVGHDEYWSWQMRQNVQAARDRGVNLGFFAANVCYWQIRFEPSLITHQINRTIVGYKESAILDPFARDRNLANDYLITTMWRNQPVNRPEDALIGMMYETFQVNSDIVVDATGPHWLLAGTQLDPTHHLRLVGLLGYEVDRIFNHAPPNTIRLAHSSFKYKSGNRYSDMTLYTAPSGAMVFATGSMQWNWGLDDYNSPGLRPSVLSADAHTITRNVLNRMIRD